MLTQVENTLQGYIVGVYLQDGNGCGHWHRLRNFGDGQGDAFMFREEIPEFSDIVIRAMAKSFDIDVVYHRIGPNRYAREKKG